MTLKLLLAHTLGIIIGALLVFCIFTENIIPNISETLPRNAFYIKLQGESGKHSDYREILRKDFIGTEYLFSSYYPHKREEGYQILKSLANSGYTPALETLQAYHLNKAREALDNKQQYKEQMMKAYKWAKRAAESGYNLPLFNLIYLYNLEGIKDIDEDLALVENWLNTTASNPFSIEYMGKYYAEHGIEEKAKHFLDLAEEVKMNPRPEPACSTITPWKGW